jgi:hypothetical protein
VNHAHLDRIQSVIAGLGAQYWGISNYFYLNRDARERLQAFAPHDGMLGSAAAHAIPEDVYLTAAQVSGLKSCLERVRKLNRLLPLRIAYAWDIDVEAYYSTRQVSRSSVCDLPYTRLDIHTDGRMAVCVAGRPVGQVGRESIAEAWRGPLMARYRDMYERTRPMPMCFRCCGLSQSIRFADPPQPPSPPDRTCPGSDAGHAPEYPAANRV